VVLLYFGEEEGRNDAARGLALRALGHGKRVLLLQCGEKQEMGERLLADSGKAQIEIKLIEKNLDTGGNAPSSQNIAVAKTALAAARQALLSGKYALLILENVTLALGNTPINEQELLALAKLVKEIPLSTDLLLSVSHAPPEIVKAADTISKFVKIK